MNNRTKVVSETKAATIRRRNKKRIDTASRTKTNTRRCVEDHNIAKEFGVSLDDL